MQRDPVPVLVRVGGVRSRHGPVVGVELDDRDVAGDAVRDPLLVERDRRVLRRVAGLGRRRWVGERGRRRGVRVEHVDDDSDP